MKKIILILTASLFSLIISSQAFSAQWSAPTGQYVTDAADRVDRLEHPSIDTLQQVDFLMCISNQRADLYPNANYKGMIDEGACQAIAGTVDPSEVVTKYAEVWNSCTRASNTAPQTCKAWFATADGGKYLATITATTAPTSARPNGEFTLTFCKANAVSGECPAIESDEGRGQLKIYVNGDDKTVFSLIDQYDDSGTILTEKLFAVSSNHLLSSMTGATLSYDWSNNSPTQKRYEIDFDGTNALVKEGSNADACYPLSNYTEYPRQYSLYSTADGSEKTLGGGLQIEVVTASGSNATAGERGYLNYWGAHVNQDSYLIDDDVVKAATANTSLNIAKNDVITIKLADGVMRERKQFTGTLPSTETQASNAPQQFSTLRKWINGTETRVYINTDNKTVIKATQACFADDSITGCDVTSDVTWDGTNAIGNNNFDVRSDRVGGWIRITNATTMAYIGRSDVRIGPGSVTTDHTYANDLYLKCYGSHCRFPTQDGSTLSTSGYSKTYFDLRTTADNDGNTGKSDKYIDPNNNQHTPVYYKLEADDMILYRCPASTWDISSGTCTGTTFYPVICDPSDANCSQTSYDNVSHMWQGNLVKATETITGWSDIDSKTEWQWNASNHVKQDKGSFPKKGSDFIIFEKPLEFVYDHSSDDDRNGATPPSSRYTLIYEGVGELHGFKWEQQSDGDYYPSITIKDGTLVDIDMDGTNDHAVLARQVKLVPTADSNTFNCTTSGLSVIQNGTTLPNLPDINAVITHKWSDIATTTWLSESPCVVDGIQQSVTGCQ